MARGLIALMMVLLIGNPFCCCAFAHGMTELAPEIRSCCQVKLDGASSPASDEELPLNCPCRTAAGVVSQDEILISAARLSAPSPMFAFSGTSLLPPAATFSPGHLLHPGRYGPVATAPPFRLLYGVFRC